MGRPGSDLAASSVEENLPQASAGPALPASPRRSSGRADHRCQAGRAQPARGARMARPRWYPLSGIRRGVCGILPGTDGVSFVAQGTLLTSALVRTLIDTLQLGGTPPPDLRERW